jgi:methylmalonyl-CoA/ethylmalonyl-CoA epimerase
MPDQGVKVAFVNTPGEGGTAGTQIELIEPLGETSPIAGFIAKNPAGGQHHLCYEVEDIEAAPRGSQPRASASLAPRASARMARRSSSCTPRTCWGS